MDRSEQFDAFNKWNEVVFQIQEENNLVDLYHENHKGQWSGAFMSDVLSKKKAFHPISEFKLHTDFLNISKDMKYVTGIIFFLKPFIINSEESDGRYYQTLADRRYLLYCTHALGTVYNFWDRIGDMLHHYFPTKIQPGNVYFGRVKDAIPETYKTRDSYLKLIELHNQIKTLLDLRHEALHHVQIETKYYWGNVENFDNAEERNRLNAEKFTYPERMKEAMKICNQAFFEAVKLIDELPDDLEIIKLRKDATTVHEENS